MPRTGKPIKRSVDALGTVLYIPNDAEGQHFLKLFRKYLNRAVYSVRVRGRNENRKQHANKPYKAGKYMGKTVVLSRSSFQDSVPLCFASYFAVYITMKESANPRFKRRRQLQEEIFNLEKSRIAMQERYATDALESARERYEELQKLSALLDEQDKIPVLAFSRRTIRVND